MKPNEQERLENLVAIESDLWENGISEIAGIDEVGRGPLAGPVVACAVVFTKELVKDLNKFTGLNDSKKVSAKNREKLYDIITHEAVDYSIGVVDEKTIDEINIYKASLLAMEKAVKSLKTLPQCLLIDGPFKIEINISQKPVKDGDSRSFTIAAASIIAKVTRDRIMQELDKEFPRYGFAVHKGYGTKRHIEAIKKFGRSRVHRKCFGKDF